MQIRLFPVAALACCQMSLSGCATVVSAAATHSAVLAAIADFAPVAIAIMSVGAIAIAGNAGSPRETHEPGTLGAYLKEKEAAVATVVKSAMQSEREVTVTSALQVQRSVARARIAFREGLDLKLDALSEPQRRYRTELESTIAALERNENRAVKEAGDRAQAIADRLPVPAQGPQLRSYGPVYLFPFLPFQSIAIRGSFPPEYPKGVVPQLSINGKSYKAYAYDTQSLSFSVPTSELSPAESQAIVWNRADLAIAWDGPTFDSFLRSAQDNFVVVGVLPHSPGRATMEHRLSIVRTEEATRTSDAFLRDEILGEEEQTGCLSLTPKELADGWRVKAGSGAFVSMAPDRELERPWQDLGLDSENGRSICWRVRHGLASAGRVAPADSNPGRIALWKISATLLREVSESRIESETFDLPWGGSRVFNYPAGSWKLRYAKYGGAVTEFSGTDLSSPLFRVDSDARSVKIRAYPF